MTNNKFNLIEDPWIPVLGENNLQSLRDVFTKINLYNLRGNPVEKIVILRFLLTITHSAIKIPDQNAWQELNSKKIASNVLAYLENWHNKFYLYGENPFLQFPALKNGTIKSIAYTQPSISVGNKVVLSSWNIEKENTDAKKILALLCKSCFGLGGKHNDKKTVLTPGLKKKKTARPGTLTGQRGYLHTYLHGNTLLETLHYNMLTTKEIEELDAFPSGLGKPFWEEMPKTEECSRAKELCSSYIGQLFPLDKFLLLKENGIVITEGIEYPNYSSGLADPALTIYIKNKKETYLLCETNRKPWQELTSILSFLDLHQSQKTPWLLNYGLFKL